ncbi:MAG: hypothetical protein AVDCRST_MAG40-3118, partial [uncultured Gemmatimonadaceae bacterium]
ARFTSDASRDQRPCRRGGGPRRRHGCRPAGHQGPADGPGTDGPAVDGAAARGPADGPGADESGPVDADDARLAPGGAGGRAHDDAEVRAAHGDDRHDGDVGEDGAVEAHDRLQPGGPARVPDAAPRRHGAGRRLPRAAGDVRRAGNVRRQRDRRAHQGRAVGAVRQGGGKPAGAQPRPRDRHREADGRGRQEDVRRADHGHEGRPAGALHRAADVRADAERRGPGPAAADGRGTDVASV